MNRTEALRRLSELRGSEPEPSVQVSPHRLPEGVYDAAAAIREIKRQTWNEFWLEMVLFYISKGGK